MGPPKIGAREGSDELLHEAIKYRRMGFPVFPVARNKVPLVDWGALQQELPDEDQICVWWEEWPEANIGIATGELSGFVVFDADGPEGVAVLESFNLPATWVSRTSRGVHYFFKHPGLPTSNRVKIRPKLDLRGDGGYVIAPPSRHASGLRYEWLTAPGTVCQRRW